MRSEDSRMRVRRMLDAAYGLYIGQEPKHSDEWRDVDSGKLYAHLKHEIGEIKRSKGRDKRFHNALDACALAAILAARIEIEGEEG